MPRYEFTEGASSKFWQIELEGDSFTVTFGKIGSAGQTTVKEWDDAATAKKQYAKLVAEKTKKGYVLVGGKPAKSAKPAKPAKVAKALAATPSASNPALEKAIDADPDNLDGWSVYADWLQGQGDPRGELGAIQSRLVGDPKNAALLAAEKKLLKDHRDVLVGPFAKYLCRSGKTEIPGVTRKPDLGPDFRGDDYDAAPIRVGWRSGFFAHAFAGYPGMDWTPGGTRKASDDDDDDDGDDSEVDFPKLLRKLLSSPAARFLTSLNLGMPNSCEDGDTMFGPVMKELALHPAAQRLRSLYLGDIVYEEAMISSIELGDLSKVLAATPQLRSLTIHANSFKLGSFVLPELRELVVISGGLDKKNVAAICAAKLPKLEKLELWFGRKEYGGTTTLKDLKPILDGTGFKSVKHLGLRNCEFADDLAAALGTAKIVKQLSSIDLSKGTLSDTGAKSLADNKAVFAHLRKLDLSDNFLGAAGAKLASSVTAQVRTKPQRKVDEYNGVEYRYPAVGE